MQLQLRCSIHTAETQENAHRRETFQMQPVQQAFHTEGSANETFRNPQDLRLDFDFVLK